MRAAFFNLLSFFPVFHPVTNADVATRVLNQTTKRRSAWTSMSVQLIMAAADSISALIITAAINANVYPDISLIRCKYAPVEGISG